MTLRHCGPKALDRYEVGERQPLGVCGETVVTPEHIEAKMLLMRLIKRPRLVPRTGSRGEELRSSSESATEEDESDGDSETHVDTCDAQRISDWWQLAVDKSKPRSHQIRRPAGQDVKYFGPFQLAVIQKNGLTIGMGITCGRHCNLSEEASGGGTQCKKQVTLGNSGLNLEDLEIRLKRWLVAGLIAGPTWGPEKRTAHVNMGWKFLHQFRSGLSSERLDQQLGELLA